METIHASDTLLKKDSASPEWEKFGASKKDGISTKYLEPRNLFLPTRRLEIFKLNLRMTVQAIPPTSPH
jgi:hypothetical protein